MRQVGAHADSGLLRRQLAPILSAMAGTLWIVGSWSFIWLSTLYADPGVFAGLAVWAAILGALGTVASISVTVKRVRSLEKAAGLGLLSRGRIVALGCLAVPWYLTWPIVVVNFSFTIQRHLNELSHRREAAADTPTIRNSPCAWAGWSRWHGHRRLLVRIARACVWAAADPEGDCRIEVSALGDTERFRTPSEFNEDATPEALHGFDSIRIEVAGERARVLVRLVRRRGQVSASLATGTVTLEAYGREPASPKDEVLYARDTVAAAIDRGRGRLSRMLTGDDSSDKPLTSALEFACWEAERFVRTASVAVFTFAAFLTFAFAPWIGGGGGGEFAMFQVASAGGGAAALSFFPLLAPSVSLSETATRERVRRVAGQMAMVAVSVLFGAALRFLLGR